MGMEMRQPTPARNEFPPHVRAPQLYSVLIPHTTGVPRRRCDAQGCQRFENRLESQYEQHCLGTPNSRRSYARRADAS
jgi:hypothetical protein